MRYPQQCVAFARTTARLAPAYNECCTCLYRSAQASDRSPASRNLASTSASWRSLQHEPYCRNGSPPKSSEGQKTDVVLDGSGGLRGNHQDQWGDAGGGKTTGNKNLPFNLTNPKTSHTYFLRREQPAGKAPATNGPRGW